MKPNNVCLLFVIVYLFGYINASPPAKPPNYTNHKNYNLLPPNKICGNNEYALEDKIFGGDDAELGEFPWMARLKYQTVGGPKFLCAGNIINERYVLTAAHCIHSLENIVQVRLGEHDERTDPDTSRIDETSVQTADPVVDIDVEEIIVHEDYSTATKHNDIALIRLKNKITYTHYVAPICLPLNGESAQIGQNLTVAGWGLKEDNRTSPVKLKTFVPIVSQRRCSVIFSTANRIILPTQICAGGKQGNDSCGGDSGGPLLHSFKPDFEKYYLEGIVSFGPKTCGQKGVPGVYTRISNFIDWILNNMKPF